MQTFSGNIIILLFTLGSIYSTDASGAEQMRETNNSYNLNLTARWIPTGQRQTSWVFTSMAEDLNSELPRTNPAGGHRRTWIGELQVKGSNHVIRKWGHSFPFQYALKLAIKSLNTKRDNLPQDFLDSGQNHCPRWIWLMQKVHFRLTFVSLTGARRKRKSASEASRA